MVSRQLFLSLSWHKNYSVPAPFVGTFLSENNKQQIHIASSNQFRERENFFFLFGPHVEAANFSSSLGRMAKVKYMLHDLLNELFDSGSMHSTATFELDIAAKLA